LSFGNPSWIDLTFHNLLIILVIIMNNYATTHSAGIIDLDEPRLSRRQQSFLNLAMKIAEPSECNHRHGAVIVRGGSVLSVGMNKWRNEVALVEQLHKDGRSTDISVHAEIDALSRVADPRGATIYVARVNRTGDPRLSKPCTACSTALKDAGISKIIYTIH
jgi:deoxycytidylate deaminase